MDGGIDAETAPLVVNVGADVLVAGSAVFRATEGIADAIAHIQGALAGDKKRPAPMVQGRPDC